jgi:carotenoid cleavage dioxygenase-like enzyme
MNQAMPENRFLQGAFAPIDQEYSHASLPIQGEIPRDLNGSFYRNGPNQVFPPRGDYHLFAGDGMTHAFHIEDGKVGYCNRWIETAKFKLEREKGRAVIDPMNPFNCEEEYIEFVLTDKDGLANTACVWHGGKMLIMEEGHRPFEVDPVTLESIGSYDFGGKLTTAMTAHPKLDPVTGEMVFFAYMASGPFESDVAVHKVNSAGVLTESHTIKTPYPAMVHDFIVTENYILFPIFPLTGSLDRAMQGQPPFAWEPEKGASIGVLPRHGGTAADVRWVECDPFFVFHFMNGYDAGGKITVDGCQFAHAPLFPMADGSETGEVEASLSRWSIDMNLQSPKVKSTQIDDRASEFPVIDPRYAMADYRYGWHLTPDSSEGEMYNCVARYDHQNGTAETYSFGDRETTFSSEAIFVPKSEDAAEGEGYLLAVVTDMPSQRSALNILDAQNVGAGPLATAQLEHRLPIGFHGGWRPTS